MHGIEEPRVIGDQEYPALHAAFDEALRGFVLEDELGAQHQRPGGGGHADEIVNDIIIRSEDIVLHHASSLSSITFSRIAAANAL